ncbi:hypothetical protein ACIRRA_36745 [Nocardia sp. NPDC101769]|uniref:hypothetical protein n=1 Tax=Nocardia sp. NPDC101769 TaxID=3364333 RepID=UPI00382F5482
MTVIIGMDPHKRSATIEIIAPSGQILTAGRYSTDRCEFTEMLTTARRFADRVWAVEGCNGIGRHLTHRLVSAGARFHVTFKMLERQMFGRRNRTCCASESC